MERTLSRGKRRQTQRSSQPTIDQVPRSWRGRASPAVQAIVSYILRSWHSLRGQPRRLRSLFLAKGWSWRLRFGLFAALSLLLLWLVISKSYMASDYNAGELLATDPQLIDATDYLSRAEGLLYTLAAEGSPPAAQNASDQAATEPRDRARSQAADTSPPAPENAPNQSAAEPGDQPHPEAPPPPRPAAENAPTRIPAELSDQARAQAVALLKQKPLDPRSLRILGQLADAAGDQAKAAALMQAAAHRSLQETGALVWMMAQMFKRGDFEKTAYYADALLRTRPQLVPQVTPVLARMAENNDAISVLENLLEQNPPWRRGFFSTLPRNVSDVRTPLNLLLKLRETSIPPTAADLVAYLNFLIAQQYYEVAYYAWLQFLPPSELSKIGFLYNGSFDTEPSKLPFDWVFRSGSGVTIDIVPPPEDENQKALYIEFGYGRVSFGSVTQIVVLPPGRYQLRGKYNGEVMGRRGLRWRVTCAEGQRLGESDMVLGTTFDWRLFDFVFTVPDRNCRAQKISLVLDSRSASEQFVTGSIWYDDLEISRDQAAVISPSDRQ